MSWGPSGPYSPCSLWLSVKALGTDWRVFLSLTPAVRGVGSELNLVGITAARLPVADGSLFLFSSSVPLIFSWLFMLEYRSDKWLRGLHTPMSPDDRTLGR